MRAYMVLCFERGKNVIFWPKKKLKKRHQGCYFLF